MSVCDGVRDRLLEAEFLDGVPVLEARDQEHFARCPVCTDEARRITEGQAMLDAALGVVAGRIAVDADPARARDAASKWSTRRLTWRVAVPLAAAALGGVAFFGTDGPVTPGVLEGPEWSRPVASLESVQPVVSTSHDRVVVLPTENPDLTVVWFMD